MKSHLSRYLIVGSFALALPLAANAATHAQNFAAAVTPYPKQPQSDRFSPHAHGRRGTKDRIAALMRQPIPSQPVLRDTTLPGTPYQITDLTPYVKRLLYGRGTGARADGAGFPTGVNNLGRIAVIDPCGCFLDGAGDYEAGSFSGVFDLAGHIYNVMLPIIRYDDVGDWDVNALNDTGAEAGAFSNDQNPSGIDEDGNIGWTDSGKGSYMDTSAVGGYRFATAINDRNVAVGQSAGLAAAFSYGRPLTALSSPKPRCQNIYALAFAINDSGTIVGVSCDRAAEFSLTGPGTYLDVASAGVSSVATAINAAGDIVGAAGSRAFLYRNGRTTYIPRPRGETSGNARAVAINANDDVVVEINNDDYQPISAFIYKQGRSYDLNALLPAASPWHIYDVTGINDNDQIVGLAQYMSSSGRGISMQPLLRGRRFGMMQTRRVAP